MSAAEVATPVAALSTAAAPPSPPAAAGAVIAPAVVAPETKVSGEKRKPILANLDEWEDVKKLQRQDEPAASSSEAKSESKGESKETKHAPSVDNIVPGDESKALVDDELGKPKDAFRNYVDSAQQERVSKFYTEQHREMTYDVVKSLEDKYLALDKEKYGIWEALQWLCSLVDASDPDTDLSQMQHALQTAEAIRKKYPGEEYDWFHVVGLIHDLGKILSLSPKMQEPQWCVVGDTFPVGCKFSDKIVFSKTFDANPDSKHPVYSTRLGVYTEGCGLKNVKMSWGHDEYLYQVCVRNNATLPEPALYMIRYHSFYPWHREGAYDYLLDEKDREMLKWVKEFNQFDLYSKADCTYNPEELAVYYKKAIAKYFPAEVNW